MTTKWPCLLIAMAFPALAFAFDGEDAYGPGVHQDRYGRAFQFETDDGETVPGGVRVRPNGYGLGVHQDAYGRPVRARAMGTGKRIGPNAFPDD